MAEHDPEGGLHPGFDTTVAHPARVYDYWLGGKDNFAADKKAAEAVIAVRPSIIRDIRANREFLGRAVRYLASEGGPGPYLASRGRYQGKPGRRLGGSEDRVPLGPESRAQRHTIFQAAAARARCGREHRAARASAGPTRGRSAHPEMPGAIQQAPSLASPAPPGANYEMSDLGAVWGVRER